MLNCRDKILLENEWILAEILPGDGGRISRIFDKKHSCELIWSNPRTEDVPRYYGCNYDDLSASGIEEAFPTVQPCKIGDADLPFFGEIWTIPWRYTQHDREIILTCESPVWTARMEKRISLCENCLNITYKIVNTGTKEFGFLFGFHPSLCIYESSRLYVPEGSYDMYMAEELEKGKTERFRWPFYHGRDLSDAGRYNTGFFNFLMHPVREGCYGIVHEQEKTGLKIEFDKGLFRCLSLWPIYGGWRGHACIMTEAFTTWPVNLEEAIRKGRANILTPSEHMETTVKYTVGKADGKE